MDDLISRAAAIAEVEQWAEHGYDVIHWTGIKAMLEAQPAVDAVPVVHGRWVYEHGDPAMMPCSVCGYQVFRYNNTHYCPNCGAKMDGERRDDDALSGR